MPEHNSQGELHLFLGRLDGKMDMILANQSGTNHRLDRHEDRIEKLESGNAQTKGGASVGSQLITWFISGLALVVSAGTFLKGLIH